MRFVTLLTGSLCSKTGEGEKIGRSVSRGMYDGFGGVNGRDIGILGVVAIVAYGEVGEGGEVTNAAYVGAEAACRCERGGVGGVATATVARGFFTGFLRTCLCSLVLLPNFSGQRLQANSSTFSFARPFSSVSCCLE